MVNPPILISAIVPAHNEEPTIGAIVKTLTESRLFEHVVVVADGCDDRTAEIARTNGVDIVLESKEKRGKGLTMRRGVEAVDSPLIFFLDADLIGLREEHLHQLIEPAACGEVAMCVGLRDRGRFWTWLEQFLPLIGGERVLKREMFEAIPDKYLQGFGVETALNSYCHFHHLKIGTRKLKGLHIRHKTDKVGFWKGLVGYFSMAREMWRAFWIIQRAKKRKEF